MPSISPKTLKLLIGDDCLANNFYCHTVGWPKQCESAMPSFRCRRLSVTENDKKHQKSQVNIIFNR